MALLIKDRETDRFRTLVERTGESITEAVKRAVRERLNPPLAISAVTLHKASIVISGKARQAGVRLFDESVRNLAIAICGVAVEDALAARHAYFKYGRGYQPAAPNLADCFSYVLAKFRNEPLLFKGDDFAKTDVVAAWGP